MCAAAALALAGCSDLSTIAVLPHSLVVTPFDTLVTEGDQARLTVTVLDENKNVIPGPPNWTPLRWVVCAPRGHPTSSATAPSPHWAGPRCACRPRSPG